MHANRNARPHRAEVFHDRRKRGMDVAGDNCRLAKRISSEDGQLTGDLVRYHNRGRLRGRELFNALRLIDEGDLACGNLAEDRGALDFRSRIALDLTSD
jgi:hypothetical protein